MNQYIKMLEHQFNELFGGTLKEVLWKTGMATAAILYSILFNSAYLLLIFTILLIVDAVLGAMVSVRINKQPLNGFYLVSGPGVKLIVTALMMFAMSALDDMVANTKVSAWVDQPFVVGIGGAVCFSMALDGLLKYVTLTGNTWLLERISSIFGKVIPEGLMPKMAEAETPAAAPIATTTTTTTTTTTDTTPPQP